MFSLNILHARNKMCSSLLVNAIWQVGYIPHICSAYKKIILKNREHKVF